MLQCLSVAAFHNTASSDIAEYIYMYHCAFPPVHFIDKSISVRRIFILFQVQIPSPEA